MAWANGSLVFKTGDVLSALVVARAMLRGPRIKILFLIMSTWTPADLLSIMYSELAGALVFHPFVLLISCV